MNDPAFHPHRPAVWRTVCEAGAFARRILPPGGWAELLDGAPRGDGHAVLVFPSSLRGDGQTAAIRAYLDTLGYRTFGWTLGVNFGPSPKVLSAITARLQSLSREHGPVSLVGFSMGGLYARWLGLRAPAHVRQVITGCSPYRAPESSLFLPIERLIGAWPGPDLRALAAELAQPLAVPATYLFSRDDGIVAWESCCDPGQPENNIDVGEMHVAVAVNPRTFRAVAERLARAPSHG